MFHWQNLKKEDRTKHLLNGRAWLGEFEFEWSIPTRFWHIHLNLNYYDDAAIGLSIALGLFSFHIENRNKWLFRQLEKITKRKDQKYTNGRIIGISHHARTFWFSLWDDPMEHRGVDPKWWKFNFNYEDFLLGKAKHKLEILEEGKAKIDMPEGDYDAAYKVEKRTWKRPRWPFTTTKTSIYFDIPVGLPHEGKGENSWDMGMDATMGTGTEWTGKLNEATKKIAMEALKTRQRYGSLNSPNYAKWRKEGLARLKKKKHEHNN